MKKLFMVLLAGMVLLTPSCDFAKSINPFGKKAREAEALRQQQEAFRVADSIRVANEQAALEQQRQAELARQAEQEALERSLYHVIVGSFLTPEYADHWLRHITEIGYNARLVEMDGGRWRLVSANSFATLREAYNALEDIQNNINGDAWVYRME
ncbi:MAG: SPOR domain-containing protein [Bacteroidales bacterium]|nr:SPOR domain-containing protein [Bacteroidales bacterium]